MDRESPDNRSRRKFLVASALLAAGEVQLEEDHRTIDGWSQQAVGRVVVS